ncbi:hypothetical protein RO3G_08723 [Rhizopus delemar RA 99-880]|uniref:Uncharacterized protein n=1 Tax=Rhizopus delemar (strain RA 99-880 / ATCC MYA-4621 / FGSC 9543 / NRRL 43880) TaxID=246409 RepID=I1C6D8_RHIO9|nr:hypothetical protein RO3G_08723 [Rhizopus delemar RA 99-880]|eukprot:EIE84018.1 hypothetical protein RO3G_08723 [Rhizopus delemar RA 99-880]
MLKKNDAFDGKDENDWPIADNNCLPSWTEINNAFNFFSPHLTFTQDDVCSILFSFQRFPFVDNTDLRTLSCCVLSVIWRAHWRFVVDGFPFIDKQLVTCAMSQFATLKRRRLELD